MIARRYSNSVTLFREDNEVSASNRDRLIQVRIIHIGSFTGTAAVVSGESSRPPDLPAVVFPGNRTTRQQLADHFVGRAMPQAPRMDEGDRLDGEDDHPARQTAACARRSRNAHWPKFMANVRPVGAGDVDQAP
jgi:hypothetical protein